MGRSLDSTGQQKAFFGNFPLTHACEGVTDIAVLAVLLSRETAETAWIGGSRGAAGERAFLDEAEKMGGLYGSEASSAGLSLAETVEAFLFFRSPVLDAITGHLRRRSAEVSDVTTAFHEANAAIDQVLVALVSSHRESR